MWWKTQKTDSFAVYIFVFAALFRIICVQTRGHKLWSTPSGYAGRVSIQLTWGKESICLLNSEQVIWLLSYTRGRRVDKRWRVRFSAGYFIGNPATRYLNLSEDDTIRDVLKRLDVYHRSNAASESYTRHTFVKLQ
jgi:hypothetical protein